jgi:hypothetical protein
MTNTRWAVVAFWVVMMLIGVYSIFDYTAKPAPPPVPEKHWFPPPLPGSVPARRSPDALVKLTHYLAHIKPGATSFDVDVIVQNVGSKKATGVVVLVHPYVGTRDTDKKAIGPDEIPMQQGGDPLAAVTQTLTYPDLKPGETGTQSFTLPIRFDADPAQRDDKAQVMFQTVP